MLILHLLIYKSNKILITAFGYVLFFKNDLFIQLFFLFLKPRTYSLLIPVLLFMLVCIHGFRKQHQVLFLFSPTWDIDAFSSVFSKGPVGDVPVVEP